MYYMPSILGSNFLSDWMDSSLSDLDQSLFDTCAHDGMKTDIKETKDAYELAIDLPGYQKDQVSVRLDQGYLVVSTEKKTENEEKDENGKYLRRERFSGSMKRSFYVGDSIKQDHIQARFENGILRLHIQKEDQKKVEESKVIAIEG